MRQLLKVLLVLTALTATYANAGSSLAKAQEVKLKMRAEADEEYNLGTLKRTSINRQWADATESARRVQMMYDC
jgi:hypothetical protein